MLCAVVHTKGHAMPNDNKDLAGIILSVYDGLPPSERLIADYMLSHAPYITKMTAREIAEGSGTSTATMSRFVRTLGFDSFSQMRFVLSQKADNRDSGAATPVSISSTDVSHSIAYILDTKQRELADTAAKLDPNQVRRALALIKNAGFVAVCGVGNTIPVSQNMAFKLGQVGVRAAAAATSDGSELLASTLTKHDLLIVLSTSGQSNRLAGVMDTAIDCGTPVLMITANENAALASRADVVLAMATRDQLLTRKLRFSQMSMIFVIEVLVILLFNDSSEGDERVATFERSLDYDRNTQAGTSSNGDDVR